MVKKLFNIVALMAIMLVACEGFDSVKSKVVITSQTKVSVGKGSAMGIIAYTIENPVDGYTVNATTDVEWINSFDYKVAGKIGFKVDTNPNDFERTGVITVAYGDSSQSVTIRQAANPAPTNINVEAQYLDIKYFGVQQGMYNYYLSFSDLGMNGNNYSSPNAKYYFVDLYLAAAGSAADGYKLPLGTYELDKSNSGGIYNSFKDTFSWYQINDNDGAAKPENQIHYDSGTLIVEEGKITLRVELEVNSISEAHTVVFSGDYNMIVEL